MQKHWNFMINWRFTSRRVKKNCVIWISGPRCKGTLIRQKSKPHASVFVRIARHRWNWQGRIMPPTVRFVQRHLLRTRANIDTSNPVRFSPLPWTNSRRNRPCQHGWDGCGLPRADCRNTPERGERRRAFTCPTGPLMRIQNRPIAVNAGRFITKHAR